MSVMDDAEKFKWLIGLVEEDGFGDMAKRLTHLHDVTEEDEESISVESLDKFVTFATTHHDMHPSDISITNDGLVEALWKRSRFGTLVADFQESGDVRFNVLYGHVGQKTKRHTLGGDVPNDVFLKHLKDFLDGAAAWEAGQNAKRVELGEFLNPRSL